MFDNQNLQALLAKSETFPVEFVTVPVKTMITMFAGKIVDPIIVETAILFCIGRNVDHSFCW